MPASSTLNIRLPSSEKKRLARLAKATSRSEDVLAAEAVTEYLDVRLWQLEEINKGLAEADAGKFAADSDVTRFFARYEDQLAVSRPRKSKSRRRARRQG